MKAYLVIITWPNGVEGLLFPRPGNVAIADTEEKGKADFEKAKQDLLEYDAAARARGKPPMTGTKVSLVCFEQAGPVIKAYTHA